MFNILYLSTGLQLCGLFFLLFATYMFFREKREKNYITRLFKYLLIVTIILNVFEIITYCFSSYLNENVIVDNILARLFILSCFIWLILFYIYIANKFLIPDDENYKKNNKITVISCITLFSILFIISMAFGINLHGSSYNKEMFLIGGNSYYILLGSSGIAALLFIYIFISKFKKLDIIQKAVIIFLFFSYFAILIFQMITGYEFSYISYMYGIIVVAIYFTVEGTDYNTITSLKRSQEQAKLRNESNLEFIKMISNDVINPLNNVLNVANNIRFNSNNETVKQDISYINNEVTRLSSKFGGGR